VVAEALGQLLYVHAIGERHAGVIAAQGVHPGRAVDDVPAATPRVFSGAGMTLASASAAFQINSSYLRARMCLSSVQRKSKFTVTGLPGLSHGSVCGSGLYIATWDWTICATQFGNGTIRSSSFFGKAKTDALPSFLTWRRTAARA
jgi:hypothetical protein